MEFDFLIGFSVKLICEWHLSKHSRCPPQPHRSGPHLRALCPPCGLSTDFQSAFLSAVIHGSLDASVGREDTREGTHGEY